METVCPMLSILETLWPETFWAETFWADTGMRYMSNHAFILVPLSSIFGEQWSGIH